MEMNRIKKRRRNKTILATILSVLFIFSVFAGLYLFNTFAKPYNEGEEQVKVKEPEKDKPVVILVVGTDERKKERGRADTLLVAIVDKRTGKTNLLSMPRDSYVNIPGRGMDKINHAHAFGGVQLTIETIEELLGIPVNYYVKTNFEGFKDIVDILDGIELNVDKKITGETTLNPGVQTVTGEQALTFVRFRGDAQGDFGRMERQQQFIKAVLKKTLQPGNIIKAPVLIGEIKNVMETNMSLNDMLGFSGLLKDMDDDSLATYSLKGKPFGKNGISYVKLDEKFLKEVMTKVYPK